MKNPFSEENAWVGYNKDKCIGYYFNKLEKKVKLVDLTGYIYKINKRTGQIMTTYDLLYSGTFDSMHPFYLSEKQVLDSLNYDI